MTRIAIEESNEWIRLYEVQGRQGRQPQTNEVIALANLASARVHLETAIQHIDGQERMDRFKAEDR